MVPEPLAAAIGARIPVNSPSGNMVVDIGGGRTEAAVISMYGIVVSESVRVAGDRLDDAIVAYIKRRYNLMIGDRTAEEMKSTIGAAVPLDQELKMDIRGRDQISGLREKTESRPCRPNRSWIRSPCSASTFCRRNSRVRLSVPGNRSAYSSGVHSTNSSGRS